MPQLFEVNMYDLQPIRDRETHRAALIEIERLFDAPAGTPEFDRLEILVTLVEAYERKHEPILPPEPFAKRLRSENRGYSLLHGKSRINKTRFRTCDSPVGEAAPTVVVLE